MQMSDRQIVLDHKLVVQNFVDFCDLVIGRCRDELIRNHRCVFNGDWEILVCHIFAQSAQKADCRVFLGDGLYIYDMSMANSHHRVRYWCNPRRSPLPVYKR